MSPARNAWKQARRHDGLPDGWFHRGFGAKLDALEKRYQKVERAVQRLNRIQANYDPKNWVARKDAILEADRLSRDYWDKYNQVDRIRYKYIHIIEDKLQKRNRRKPPHKRTDPHKTAPYNFLKNGGGFQKILLPDYRRVRKWYSDRHPRG